MYDWSTSKHNITGSLSEKNFLKIDVCVKLHESKNALFFDNFLNYVTRYNVQKFFQSLHIMYDWTQVKIISLETFLRNIFKN